MVKLYNKVTVGTAPTIIAPSSKKRSSLYIFNNDLAIVMYLGSDREVTNLTGIPVFPQTGLTFLKGLGDDPSQEFFGIVGVAPIDVRWFEMYTGE
jgi:hypothetical protein